MAFPFDTMLDMLRNMWSPTSSGSLKVDLVTSSIATTTTQLPASIGQKTMAASLPVVIASDQSVVQVNTPLASTSIVTSTAASLSSQVLLAANANRKGAIIYNDSTSILLLLVNPGTASPTNLSARVYPQRGYFIDALYTGAITGVWIAAVGASRNTEFV